MVGAAGGRWGDSTQEQTGAEHKIFRLNCNRRNFTGFLFYSMLDLCEFHEQLSRWNYTEKRTQL